MTVRVERTVQVSAPPAVVWEFLADPAQRAAAISAVQSYEVRDDNETTWEVELPIPLIRRTVTVTTRDVERIEDERVEFVGSGPALRVTGTHEIEPDGDRGTIITNRFIVEGRLPGVERYFEKNLDRELTNLEHALRDYLETA